MTLPRFIIAPLMLLVWLCALPLTALAEEVVLGLSKDKVSITTRFDGSDILIFGAVKREVTIPDGSELEVIITVAGPSEPVLVRRKERRMGIWVNTDSVEVDRAPTFYAVAASGPLDDVLSNVEDLRHSISVPRAIRSVGAPQNIKDASVFTDALIRIKRQRDLYQLLENEVTVDQQTLFQASIQLPASLSEGEYDTRIYLTRDGKIISQYNTTIDVEKVGLERWLWKMSREQPFFYGIMSLVMAVAAGWLASSVFRLFGD